MLLGRARAEYTFSGLQVKYDTTFFEFWLKTRRRHAQFANFDFFFVLSSSKYEIEINQRDRYSLSITIINGFIKKLMSDVNF